MTSGVKLVTNQINTIFKPVFKSTKICVGNNRDILYTGSICEGKSCAYKSKTERGASVYGSFKGEI